MASWICDYSQYANLFNLWVNMFFFGIYVNILNNLKLIIQKYYLLLELIATQFLMMMM